MKVLIAVLVVVVVIAIVVVVALRQAQQRKLAQGREQAQEGRHEARLEHLEANRREAEAQEHAARAKRESVEAERQALQAEQTRDAARDREARRRCRGPRRRCHPGSLVAVVARTARALASTSSPLPRPRHTDHPLRAPRGSPSLLSSAGFVRAGRTNPAENGSELGGCGQASLVNIFWTSASS